MNAYILLSRSLEAGLPLPIALYVGVKEMSFYPSYPVPLDCSLVCDVKFWYFELNSTGGGVV